MLSNCTQSALHGFVDWKRWSEQSDNSTREGSKKQAYRVKISHPLYRTLMETYGLTARPRNAKRRRGAGLDADNHDREENLSDYADEDFTQDDDDEEEEDFEQEDR